MLKLKGLGVSRKGAEGNSRCRIQQVSVATVSKEKPKGHNKLMHYSVTKSLSLKFADHWFYLSSSPPLSLTV